MLAMDPTFFVAELHALLTDPLPRDARGPQSPARRRSPEYRQSPGRGRSPEHRESPERGESPGLGPSPGRSPAGRAARGSGEDHRNGRKSCGRSHSPRRPSRSRSRSGGRSCGRSSDSGGSRGAAPQEAGTP